MYKWLTYLPGVLVVTFVENHNISLGKFWRIKCSVQKPNWDILNCFEFVLHDIEHKEVITQFFWVPDSCSKDHDSYTTNERPRVTEKSDSTLDLSDNVYDLMLQKKSLQYDNDLYLLHLLINKFFIYFFGLLWL